MRELSLYILDIVQNSIAAGATQVEILLEQDTVKDLIQITIVDNGRGMGKDELAKAVDPFYTSRTSRKVGLGLSLYKAHALECGGDFFIDSQVGQGTKVVATFRYSHIDRVPLGNMSATITTIIAGNKDLRLIYNHSFNGQQFYFDTEQVKEHLEDVPINEPTVLQWIGEYIGQGDRALYDI